MRLPLPRTAKDVFVLSPRDRLLFGGVIELQRRTGSWKYPIAASGDLETMRKRDLIYWLYKAQYPVEHAERGSGLEDFFRTQRFGWNPGSLVKTDSELSVSSVGDIMHHPYIGRSEGVLYENVADIIFDADVAMANMGCVVRTGGAVPLEIGGKASPALSMSSEELRAVAGHQGRGFVAMSASNNHSLDFGEEGVRSTMDALRVASITPMGVNESEEASRRATIIEKNGFKIGALAHTFGLNARKPPVDGA
jgi:hypothetical protein